jgi:hypothetical protein
MNGKIYRARFKKIEKAMAPLEPFELSVTIGELPPPEERKRIEAENPGERHHWVDLESIKQHA